MSASKAGDHGLSRRHRTLGRQIFDIVLPDDVAGRHRACKGNAVGKADGQGAACRAGGWPDQPAPGAVSTFAIEARCR